MLTDAKGGERVPRTKKYSVDMQNDYEPYLKTAQIRDLFKLSYGFISKSTKRDPAHPDRPVLQCIRVGREMRFRRSEVEKFLEQYSSWYDSQH